MPDLFPTRFVAYLRTQQPNGRPSPWRAILTRDTEAEAWKDLYEHQRYDLPQRDLCVVKEGKRP